MKKTVLIYLLCVFSVLISSCEYELYSLRGTEDKGMICVQVLSGLADTTVITVAQTLPVGRNEADLPEISADHIVMTVNGRPVEIKGADKLYTTAEIRPGDELTIEVDSPDDEISPVFAETVVPDEVPEFTVTGEKTYFDVNEYLQYCSINQGGLHFVGDPYNEAVRLKITFKDNPDSKDRYAVQLRTYREKEYKGEAVIYYFNDGFLLPNASMLSTAGRFLPIFNLGEIFTLGQIPYGGAALTYFSDSGFNGQDVTKEYMMQYDETFRYEVLLFKMSEELCRAVDAYYTYISGYYGLGEFSIYYPYTNIRNGVGCFGAAVVKSSGLMKFDF